MMKSTVLVGTLLLGSALLAAEYHVSPSGNNANPGTRARPFRAIQRAADLAQPGDVITVHEGVYRERVNPPRGGTSDKKRITYQAARGEKVVITGSEPIKGWEQVGGDTWKVVIPNKYFGRFNPYADTIHGDWFSGNGRQHHTGCVYLNGDWFIEAASHLNEVLAPPGKTPLWFASVDNAEDSDYLLNLAGIIVGEKRIAADTFAAKQGELHPAACSEGGQCIGWIRAGSWLQFDKVNFGTGTESVSFRAASVTGGGSIEIHADTADGKLLGTGTVADTGDWQKWQTFTAKIEPISGEKTICLVFRSRKSETDNTTIWAQFPGVNPNEAKVEINVRQTVFTPEQPGVNYLTVRGFDLRNAATPWAPPSAGQFGVVSAYWCKGWIIEDNEISYSKCSGVALGKYSDEFDNTNDQGAADPYTDCVRRALTNGWNQATVGSHIVRNNHIHHCEQTGIVGSLGCAFSTVTGNEIHDIHLRALFGGAEMAGIKFHGAIDVVISHNHIYRCGSVAGIWLDWMAQGAQVTGNLLHDNSSQDIFLEMQHGPLLVANNLLLTKRRAFDLNSQGVAFVHNLIAGTIASYSGDTRATPFQKAHSTELAGLHTSSAQNDSGDYRFYNNLCVAPCDLHALDKSAMPCFAAGNVFTQGAQPSKFDTAALVLPDFDADVRLEQKADGWYLTLAGAKAWRNEAKCQLVTTDLLGKAKVSDCAYEHADGSPLRVNTDYFGRQRNKANPTPGPFENPGPGALQLKVW